MHRKCPACALPPSVWASPNRCSQLMAPYLLNYLSVFTAMSNQSVCSAADLATNAIVTLSMPYSSYMCNLVAPPRPLTLLLAARVSRQNDCLCKHKYNSTIHICIYRTVCLSTHLVKYLSIPLSMTSRVSRRNASAAFLLGLLSRPCSHGQRGGSL